MWDLIGRGRTYDFRHVENDNGRLEANTETGDETTGDNSTERITSASDHLNGDTDDVDEAAKDNSPLAANHVGKITSNESAKEGTAGQDRDDERRVGFADFGGQRALDGVDEDLGSKDTVDITGIVTEEDTAERGEGADEVRLPRHGRLNSLNILSDGEGSSVVRSCRHAGLLLGSRHCCSVLSTGCCRWFGWVRNAEDGRLSWFGENRV